MEIVSIERKTFEEMKERFGELFAAREGAFAPAAARPKR